MQQNNEHKNYMEEYWENFGNKKNEYFKWYK
jgi:hypothetical protein